MLKFAFIENVAGASSEKDFVVYENDASYCLLAATGSDAAAEALVKKLDAEGYDMIDLCGDFNGEHVKTYESMVKNNIKIRHADYLPDELVKLNQLEALKEYGIVVVMDGVDKTERFDLKLPECNTYIHYVSDMEAAKQSAKELVSQGVDFIELCSYFNQERTQAVIEAIDGKVPVGSCGV